MVTIRILQINNQPEIRINDPSGVGYHRHDLTPQALLNIALDALNAYNQLRSSDETKRDAQC
jgi:hypothetical protein